jgi:hypothetical protein
MGPKRNQTRGQCKTTLTSDYTPTDVSCSNQDSKAETAAKYCILLGVLSEAKFEVTQGIPKKEYLYKKL